MKVVVMYVNDKKGVYDDMLSEYKKRLTRYVTFEEFRIDHSDKKKESEVMMSKIEKSDFVILLDENGKQLKSVDFAEFVGEKMVNSTKRLVFIIGGAYGVSDEVKERANYTLALSEMIMPHEMARLIITEQIYRAFNIISGGAYHHG